MADIRPFSAVRPDTQYASRVAALPYDVYNEKEAREKVKGDDLTFLRIDRAETQLPGGTDIYSDEVYEKARELYLDMKNKKIFITDPDICYYIYSLVMNGRRQTGITAVSSVDDYDDNVIKKHENTRADKEEDRIRHVDALSAQTGPIFLAYRSRKRINDVVERIMQEKSPIYSFTADDGVTHEVWKIKSPYDIDMIRKEFAAEDSVYIADGHHRAASAVKVSHMRRAEAGSYTGNEEFNFFLSVLFPDDELMIMDYNRTVHDLNGLSEDEFIKRAGEHFDITPVAGKFEKPSHKGQIGMYLEGKWYMLEASDELKSISDPVKSLDVSLLQDYILGPVLGIEDPRTDKRIDFVGGIRGTEELEKRADTDMKISFCMYPTSIHELFNVADAGLLMPPKSTWFEPKLRSGLFIHEI